MPTITKPRLFWALHLADRGWPVFPLLPGSKRPALHGDSTDRPCPRTGCCRDGHQGWEQRATTDQDRISAFWTGHPNHNVGVACGRAGLLVIDLDVAKPGKPLPADCIQAGVRDGAGMLATLAARHRATVPGTWTVRTPSGGTHLYFLQPAGMSLGSTKGSDTAGLGGLVDTRGWGGLVVAPGSTAAHAAYELVDDTDPVTLPDWINALLVSPSRRRVAAAAPPVPAGRLTAYVAAAVAGEEERVRTAPEGNHNRPQWIAGLALGRLVGAGHLEREYALRKLLDAAAGHINGSCHCTERGVRATFEWGLDRGSRNAGPGDRPRHPLPNGSSEPSSPR